LNKIITISIPAYNRPETLSRLLNSIPSECSDDIDILVIEDNSPKRLEIRKVIVQFRDKGLFDVKYIENEENLGFDGNIKKLVEKGEGEYMMLMGDDDFFIKNNLYSYIEFVKKNRNLGYILKNWKYLHSSGWEEPMNYFSKSQLFEPGVDTLLKLFRISVAMSGFNIKREYLTGLSTDIFNGTLLYQIYLLSEVVLKYPCGYCDIPIVYSMKEKTEVPFFGNSENEKHLYDPGIITIRNSVNFMMSFFRISDYLDEKYKINFSEKLRKNLSKYSYRVLAIQRQRVGIIDFIFYFRQLNNRVKINNTIYYYIYFIALLIFGTKICDSLLFLTKRIFRKTPN